MTNAATDMDETRLTSIWIHRLKRVRIYALRHGLTLKDYINNLIKEDMERNK